MNKTMRRKERELNRGAAYQILVSCEYAVLATIDADDASPYCIPISPVAQGNHIYFHCAPQGHKLDNLRRDSRVCLTCVGKTKLVPEEFTTLYESAVIRGKVQFVQEDLEKRYALRLLCEKYAPSNLKEFDRAASASLSRTAICKIEIESVVGKTNFK